MDICNSIHDFDQKREALLKGKKIVILKQRIGFQYFKIKKWD
jgi:hypothetical protein